MDNIGHETWWNYFVENCNDVCPKCGKRITRYENGLVYAWSEGRTSWTTQSSEDSLPWGNAKLAESEEQEDEQN